MIAKCPCQNCGQNIEFDTAYIDEQITCPHCSKLTSLHIPAAAAKAIHAIAVAAITPVEVPKKEKKHLECSFTKFFAIVIFIAGGCMAFNGVANEVDSKTVFQQGNANMGFYAGFIMVALSFVMWGIARITEAVVNGE